ncbi:hypothetical protein NQ176_g3624 [Zarea fungicola]|uniref:Uncharacterized protein n=1 Tax=Zarea fungicola TaxID=93591 RepID=A0ACC1NHH1_9HYPO|nr:hypothetical protein NQ176_g3624 [Lecanicillium fungicola]
MIHLMLTTSLKPPPPPPPPPSGGSGIPENPGGTDLFINSGCVLVNGSPRCNGNAGKISEVYQSSYHVNADQGDYSTATILASFDTGEWYAPQLPPGCQLNARWPRNYGQVFFGADNCLYDASGSRIDNQCCGTPDSSHSGSTINPWRDPRPAGSCQRTPGFGFVHFEVYSKGWITDGGASLRHQVNGCGAVTGPAFGTNNDIEIDGSDANIGYYQAEYLMHFNLPATFKPGCVGRAMESAGAPHAKDYC